jgi:hypothetical protein
VADKVKSLAISERLCGVIRKSRGLSKSHIRPATFLIGKNRSANQAPDINSISKSPLYSGGFSGISGEGAAGNREDLTNFTYRTDYRFRM